MIRALLKAACCLALVSSMAEASSMFDAGKHCVGYKFKKKSLSMFSRQVVGKNCDISAQFLPVVGGGYQVEVSVPITAFDSGDKDWDQDFRDLLKAGEQPDIIFRTKVFTEKEWKQLVEKTSVTVDGELNINNKTYDVSMPVQIKKITGGIEVDGMTTVPFSKFELEPPKTMGGLITKADSDLELHFHLVSDKILGADKIFSKPEKDKDIIKDAMKAIDDDDFDVDSPSPSDSAVDKTLEPSKQKEDM